jgi:hypothetical protein
MQYPFSAVPSVLANLENTLSPQRMGRYLVAAKGDKHKVLRLYVWNARLCEAFYLPCQLAEVAVRNRLHAILSRKFSANWHLDNSFISPLPKRFQDELKHAIQDCRWDHGGAMTVNHVVGSLAMGFWCHLLTQNFDHILWLNGMRNAFPGLPRNQQRQDVYNKVDRLRQWRNRIAHHGVIIDKNMKDEIANIELILSWICPDTTWFMTETCAVQYVINQRPRY